MRNSKRRILSIILSLFMMTTSLSLAHSRRTGNNGGDHDYRNKSGLGSYHYHHGYSTHLHPNGQCQYEKLTPAFAPKKATPKKAPAVNPNIRSVYIPDYTISINGQAVDNLNSTSPFFSYNNIIYIPLTWNHVRCLGLESEWNSVTGLKLTTSTCSVKVSELPKNSIPYKANGSYEATKTDAKVFINDEELTQSEQYPFFNFWHITYIPLTSNNAAKLGLQTEWNDQTGFSINKIAKQ
ncbi:hypothetical protein [Tepidibacter hydrothermalis]|uniref:YHYH domain-containing protein n=1 Tax=Tepidibacter hydrothermalis TaxID=3036126 RepID=A0ABY8EHL8_9FIRM|nr:hypothetical protein [Tepidibacter hydrothermalis]WFD12429.1 hypothetical protein P4S50_20050 [Tepidibacter hydrothermalis]